MTHSLVGTLKINVSISKVISVSNARTENLFCFLYSMSDQKRLWVNIDKPWLAADMIDSIGFGDCESGILEINNRLESVAEIWWIANECEEEIGVRIFANDWFSTLWDICKWLIGRIFRFKSRIGSDFNVRYVGSRNGSGSRNGNWNGSDFNVPNRSLNGSGIGTGFNIGDRNGNENRNGRGRPGVWVLYWILFAFSSFTFKRKTWSS